MALFPVEHSIVAEVQFAGFRSDTHTLQRHGWEIVFEAPNHHWHGDGRMALRHKDAHLVATAECRDFHDIVALSRRHRGAPRPLFTVLQCAPDIRMRGVAVEMVFAGYERINAVPNMMMMEEISLYDLPAFAPIVAQPTKEDLIIDPSDVSAMLDMIRRKQAPIQDEIRARTRRREIIPIQHATIYTLPLAA